MSSSPRSNEGRNTAILLAGVAAFAVFAWSTRHGEPQPVPDLAPAGGETAETDAPRPRRGASERDAGPVFVPNLPAVPDLSARPARPAPPPGDDSLLAEARLLDEARTLLEDHPSRVLEITAQHLSRFPDGALREQREAYACLALAALDRHDELARRYTDFVEAFPTSSFLPRISRAMSREPR